MSHKKIQGTKQKTATQERRALDHQVNAKKKRKKSQQIYSTKAESQWIVAHRPLSQKRLTIPRPLLKSSTMDLFPQTLPDFVQYQSMGFIPPARTEMYDLWVSPIMIRDNISGTQNQRLFSMDSGLEAFSLNPAHGSFSALTFQSTELTKYVNQRFLSY